MAPGRQQDRAVFGKQDVHVLGIRDVENEKMPWGEEAEIDLGDRAFEPNGDGKCLGRAPLLSAGMAKTSDRKPDEHEPAKHWHGNLQSLSQPRAWLPNDLRFCCGGLRRPPPSPQTYPARGRRAEAPGSSKRGLGGAKRWRQVETVPDRSGSLVPRQKRIREDHSRIAAYHSGRERPPLAGKREGFE